MCKGINFEQDITNLVICRYAGIRITDGLRNPKKQKNLMFALYGQLLEIFCSLPFVKKGL